MELKKLHIYCFDRPLTCSSLSFNFLFSNSTTSTLSWVKEDDIEMWWWPPGVRPGKPPVKGCAGMLFPPYISALQLRILKISSNSFSLHLQARAWNHPHRWNCSMLPSLRMAGLPAIWQIPRSSFLAHRIRSSGSILVSYLLPHCPSVSTCHFLLRQGLLTC